MKFLSFCPIKLVPKKGIRKESLSAQILRMWDRHMKYRPFIFIIALFAGCARFQPQPISAEKTAVDVIAVDHVDKPTAN